MLIKYLKYYLAGRKKNRTILELLKLHSNYRNKYPNLIAPTFDYIATCCSVFGMYEKDELKCIENLLKKYCKNKYIIDCGANFGNHTLFFSNFSKGVFAFEPNYITYECLRLNTLNNKKIKIYNYGLLNKKIKTKMHFIDGNLGTSSINKIKNSKFIYANFKKLDSFKEISNKEISFMKIDVEDSEFKLIQGAKKILKKIPIILFEVSNYKSNDKFCEILKNKFSYKFLYVLKKHNFSKKDIFLNILNKIISIVKNKNYNNNFQVALAKKVSERSGNSHFAILSKKKIL
jgi:FkbM family methyltransferase